jgi:hypothetical protein
VAVAKLIFKVSAYSQILVGMSNIGVMFGVLSIFTPNRIKTPLPWIRFGAISLLFIWAIPFFKSKPDRIIYAWQLAPFFIPISFGWATGDIQSAAYLQDVLSKEETQHNSVSLLGAITSFLYISNVVLYAVLSTALGSYVDRVVSQDGNIQNALVFLGGTQFTVLAVFIGLSTLIPRGAWHLNPDRVHTEATSNILIVEESGTQSSKYQPIPQSVRLSGGTIDSIDRANEQTHLVGRYRYD